MDSRILTAVIVVVGVPAVLCGYIFGIEQLLKLVPARLRGRIRPWAWLAPAFALLIFFLVIPTIQTIVRSFRNRGDTAWAGTRNYEWFFSGGPGMDALFNNILWVLFLTGTTLGIGLLVAILADRVRYESFAKSVLFMPMAISAVAASLIWLFMYAYQPAGANQTGTLNGIWTAPNALQGNLQDTSQYIFQPIPFITVENLRFNTFALIWVMTWMWTGFATVILSAALKSINPELLEAARVDGANEFQVFRRITLPLLAPTLAVVSTTMIITALKAFDVVYAMTNGNYHTQVVANEMINQLFNFSHPERAAAIAVILLVAIVPIMGINIRRFQVQEAIR